MAAGVQPNSSVELPSVTLGNEAFARHNWDMSRIPYGPLKHTAKPGCGPFPPQTSHWLLRVAGLGRCPGGPEITRVERDRAQPSCNGAPVAYTKIQDHSMLSSRRHSMRDPCSEGIRRPLSNRVGTGEGFVRVCDTRPCSRGYARGFRIAMDCHWWSSGIIRSGRCVVSPVALLGPPMHYTTARRTTAKYAVAKQYSAIEC
jgi:hypothetical protein